MDSDKQCNLAVFASGTGSNAVNIAKYFSAHPQIKFKLLVCNKPKAKVIENIAPFDVSVLLVDRSDFAEPDAFLQKFKDSEIDIIALAGFLWLLPQNLVQTYHNKIINIHPALLPKYGGKGMYGNYVHEAVITSGDKYSGISIHFVNERYDEGQVIFQEKFLLEEGETIDSLKEKIHDSEHRNYPRIIEMICDRYCKK